MTQHIKHILPVVTRYDTFYQYVQDKLILKSDTCRIPSRHSGTALITRTLDFLWNVAVLGISYTVQSTQSKASTLMRRKTGCNRQISNSGPFSRDLLLGVCPFSQKGDHCTLHSVASDSFWHGYKKFLSNTCNAIINTEYEHYHNARDSSATAYTINMQAHICSPSGGTVVVKNFSVPQI